MEGYGAATYGDGFADVYDDWYRDLGDPAQTASVMLELAQGRTILELGVGTGRLALAMAARGTAVVGVDASAKMLEQLGRRRAAQATSPIHTLRADMRALPLVAGSFGAVLAAYNTVFNVGDRAGLRACFREARRVLDDAGVFVVETIVPTPADRVRSGVDVRRIAVDHVVLTASRLDPSDQTISGQHIEIAETGIRLRPWFLHYAHVDELDTIAERTGFALDVRWSDWNRSAFDESVHDTQVAVYRCA